jgi:hypothetical protein
MPEENEEVVGETTEEEKDDDTVTEEEEVTSEEKTDDEKYELSKDEYADYLKLKEKDFNFKKLRDQKKLAKQEVEKGKKELDEGWKDFRDNMIRERKEDALSLLVGDDTEIRKKVLYNYDRIKDEATTKGDIYKKMREAVNMLGDSSPSNPMSRQTRGVADRFGSNATKQESEEQRSMRQAMGISDEDKKKYGSDNWNPKI